MVIPEQTAENWNAMGCPRRALLASVTKCDLKRGRGLLHQDDIEGLDRILYYYLFRFIDNRGERVTIHNPVQPYYGSTTIQETTP